MELEKNNSAVKELTSEFNVKFEDLFKFYIEYNTFSALGYSKKDSIEKAKKEFLDGENISKCFLVIGIYSINLEFVKRISEIKI